MPFLERYPFCDPYNPLASEYGPFDPWDPNGGANVWEGKR